MKHNLQISNRALIEECRNGDKDALNLFYTRFAPRMLSVVHRYIRDPKDAEDVLHDGFIVGLTRLDSLRDADKVEIWLATIMKNLSLRFLQDQDMAQILHEIPDVEDTPEMEEILDLETLESLIAKLPAGYQKVFRLAILENKSHKEIGKLLGIAPNSSSSQLFHAKLMMRRLITEYKLQTALGIVLIALLLTGLLIPKHETLTPENHEILIASHTVEEVSQPLHRSDPAANAVAKDSQPPHRSDPAANAVAKDSQPPHRSDSAANAVAEVFQPPLHPDSAANAVAEVFQPPHNPDAEPLYVKGASAGGWSFNVGADPGLLSFNSVSQGDYANAANPGGNHGNSGGSSNSPEDPDDWENGDKNKISSSMPRAAAGYKDYRDVNHANSMPVSVAFTASKALNNVLSLETGVRYTYLHTRFETSASYANCHWHYLGIPLKLNVKLYSSRRLRLYIGAGGAVDIPLYSNSEVTATATTPDLESGRFSSPTMWSLQGNVGISIKLSKKIDLFLEPTIQYHFPQDYAVPNAWTDNPWTLSLPLGLRFNL